MFPGQRPGPTYCCLGRFPRRDMWPSLGGTAASGGSHPSARPAPDGGTKANVYCNSTACASVLALNVCASPALALFRQTGTRWNTLLFNCNRKAVLQTQHSCARKIAVATARHVTPINVAPCTTAGTRADGRYTHPVHTILTTCTIPASAPKTAAHYRLLTHL
jgi:hypothetical protein